jgi:hypothetical protein
MADRAKLASLHAFYVAGVTFFSVMSTRFIDYEITGADVHVCGFSAVIAFGLSFFTSMNLQSKIGVNGLNGNEKEKNSHSKVVNFISPLSKKIFGKRKVAAGAMKLTHAPHKGWSRT